MIQASNWIFAPFFPSVAKDERGVSSFLIGATLSIESVSFVISSYVVGLIIQPIGRRFSIYIGLAISASSLLGLGLLYWITNKSAFIIFALFLRFICGIGQSFVAVSCYAITSIKYNKRIKWKKNLINLILYLSI